MRWSIDIYSSPRSLNPYLSWEILMNNNKGVYRNKEGGVEECREYFKNLQEPHLFQEVSEIQKILGNYHRTTQELKCCQMRTLYFQIRYTQAHTEWEVLPPEKGLRQGVAPRISQALHVWGRQLTQVQQVTQLSKHVFPSGLREIY